MTEPVAVRVNVTGVVQAVGFRPFVYRRAVDHDLEGRVKNLGDAGVEILLQGNERNMEEFLEELREDNPPLARVEKLERTEVPPRDSLEGFEIVKSDSGSSGTGTIPPDVATCDDCLEDVFGDTRYEGYWATSCVNCGPRFSVIRELPYDRERTSMDEFPICKDCRSEYSDPGNRRYHAQTIACPACGPELWLEDPDSGERETKDPVDAAARELKEGRILAIKGLGGTHLACDATEDKTVQELRDRLGRPDQPFALMATEDTARKELLYDEDELASLRGPRRPIVLLEKKRDNRISDLVAPGLHNLGIMLPYTALHHLIFRELDFPLVMTSANLPGDPMLIENGSIRRVLDGIADGFLLHEREIVSRVDDSVVRFSGKGRKFIRRSRGWVPEPIDLDLGEEPLLALGAERDNVIGVYTGDKAYLSQYLGDTEGPENMEFLEEALDRLLVLTSTETPERIAHDLHPGFSTTRRAEEMGKETIPVQHHEAHVGSLLAEHGLTEIVGAIMDGLGYGRNGSIWGCEVISRTRSGLERNGSLTRAYMPGGDLATRHPARMAAGILYPMVERGEVEELESVIRELGLGFPGGEEEREVVSQQLERGLNSPVTTSAGRFLDAVSALLDICEVRTYEGQPAMELESVARGGEPVEVETRVVEKGGLARLDQSELLYRLAQLKGVIPTEDLAATAQTALAEGFSDLAVSIAKQKGIGTVGFSGGVAYNEEISLAIESTVTEAGLDYVTNEAVPVGDGGIALGQLWLAGR